MLRDGYDDAGARVIGPIVLTAAVIVICLGVHALLMRCGPGHVFDPCRRPTAWRRDCADEGRR